MQMGAKIEDWFVDAASGMGIQRQMHLWFAWKTVLSECMDEKSKTMHEMTSTVAANNTIATYLLERASHPGSASLSD